MKHIKCDKCLSLKWNAVSHPLWCGQWLSISANNDNDDYKTETRDFALLDNVLSAPVNIFNSFYAHIYIWTYAYIYKHVYNYVSKLWITVFC